MWTKASTSLPFPIIIAIFNITFGHTWLLRGKPHFSLLLVSLQVYLTILAGEAEEKERL